MAWGFVAVGQSLRGLLRRDVNLPDGGSLGIVSLIQTEGFTPAQGQVTLIGAQQQGESVGYSVSYYTTAACTQNPLYTGGGLLTFAIRGVPDQLQRPSDFHLVTATLNSASSRRSASLAFHSMGSRQFALAAFVGAPDVSTLPGVYKRLQAVFADVPSDYNGSLTLNYADGAISMTIGASSAWLASSGNTITMPDFSAVAGWSANWAVSSSNSGTWLATLDGESVAGSVCTEGRRTVQTTFSGLY
jgi:hypothetical protein